MGKVIHWELCKKFKFDHTNKRYTYNPEFVLENLTYKIFRNFEIQTNPLISTKQPDKKKKKKRKMNQPNFAVPDELKESGKRDNCQGFARKMKKKIYGRCK